MNQNSFLTPFQARKYPHFCVLLQDLFGSKLSPSVATKCKENERTALLVTFVKSRDDYETLKLTYDLIWDILTDKSSDENKVHHYLPVVANKNLL